jgi:DNA-binding GntR family transcriptional regulator
MDEPALDASREARSRTERWLRVPARPRATAATSVLAELRRAILDLTLPPGSPLSDKALTERFGVSRTPIREALIRLAEEGLVEIFPQSGTFVGRIPIAALPEAVIVRQALESAAIGFVIARADEADYGRLSGIINRQEAFAQLDDREGFHASDEAFHEALATIAGHPGLWRVAQQAKAQIDRCRLLTLPVPGRMALVIGEHRAILEACRARDEKAAQAALRAHLSAVVPDAETIRKTYPDYFV